MEPVESVWGAHFGRAATAPKCCDVRTCIPHLKYNVGHESYVQRTRQQRPQSANALKNRRYSKSTFSAVACSPMMDWMISSPSRVARASLLLPCAQQ